MSDMFPCAICKAHTYQTRTGLLGHLTEHSTAVLAEEYLKAREFAAAVQRALDLERMCGKYRYKNEDAADGTLRPDFALCGSMFGLPIRRHRVFETNWPAFTLMQPCQHHRDDLPFEHKGERAFADAMGCTWMTNRGGRQAIPPAYTRFIGEQLLGHLSSVGSSEQETA